MKVEIFTAISIDGYISGINGYEDWVLDENGSDSFENYAKTFDAITLGKNTFNKHYGIIYPIKETKNIIMTSQNIEPSEFENEFEFTNKSPEDIIENLKNRNYKKIMIVGGAKIYESFLNDDLVDELLIGLHPNILSGGTPFTSNLKKDIKLKEIDCKDADEGFKLIRYKIIK